jgi:hypothetical protein
MPVTPIPGAPGPHRLARPLRSRVTSAAEGAVMK